jgi:lipoprotein
MKSLLSLSVLSLTIVLVSCGTGSSSSKNEIDDTIKIYQTNSIDTSIKIEQIRISSDTLIMYTLDTFITYPFGVYKSISEINTSFKGEKKIISRESGLTTIDSVVYGNNLIVFIKANDPSDLYYNYVEIVYAKLQNNQIPLKKNIRIGMSQQEFFGEFNYVVSETEFPNIRIILLERMLAGMWQYYYFDQNKRLDSIIMKTDYVFSD